jgi:membrane protein
MRRALKSFADAFDRFNGNEGWAIASHIALSALMALFPFLIFVTGVAAALLGSRDLADETARILLEAWPEVVAEPIAREIQNVMGGLRGDTLTFAVALALFFSSSGVESLRIGLNRAYGVPETRPWWLLRFESICYVLVGAGALLALSFLIVLYPLIWATAIRYANWLGRFGYFLDLVRIGAAAVVLISALLVAHWWLPAGRRRFVDIVPGILVTLALWLGAGIVFGRYLASFADTYVTYYAGLASVMAALVFL